MRTKHYTNAVILGVLVFLFPFHARAGELSLQEAADLMMKHNPALAQQELESETARKQWLQSRAPYLPQLDFVQSWSRSNNPVFVFGSLLNQERFSEANFAIDALNRPDALSDFASKLQVGWLLYDFGRREKHVDSAEAGYRISTLQQEATRNALFLELVKRYYAVSLSMDRMRTAVEALHSAQSRWDQAKERTNQGLAVQTDFLSAEVFLARRKQEQIDAVNQNKLAIAALKELLGNPDLTEIETDSLEERTFPEFDLSWWQQEMRSRRPELEMVAEGRRVANNQVSSSRSEFFPSVQAWSVYELHGNTLSDTANNWSAGVELRWNLFRGFSDSQQLSVAQLQAKKAAERERETENGLLLQIESAYYHFQAATEKRKVAAAALEQAAENKRIFAERYAAGLATIQDSLLAEASYSETRLLYFQNLYEIYVAYSELLLAAGKAQEVVSIASQNSIAGERGVRATLGLAQEYLPILLPTRRLDVGEQQ